MAQDQLRRDDVDCALCVVEESSNQNLKSRALLAPTSNMCLMKEKEFLCKKGTWKLFEQLIGRSLGSHKGLFNKSGGLRKEDTRYDAQFVTC